MGSFFHGLSIFFPRFLDHSVEISILICLIFLAKLVVPRKIPPWWHYSLWLMLLLRMLVPVEFENRLNVFNFVPAPATPQVSEIMMDPSLESPTFPQGFTLEEPGMKPDVQVLVKNAVPVVWMTGAMILGICVLFESFSFWLSVRREPKVTDKKVLALLSECKSRMKIKRKVNVIVTGSVRSPALFGYIRPRLLLPEGIFEKSRIRELDYAFMHELGHLKRHDIGVSWLVAVLQVVHWFNPLVWLAFYQIRIDQESACDAAVLSRMQPRHSSDYARAIVGFLEKFCQNCQLPALAGVLENRSQMRKRIASIVCYRKSSHKLSFAAAGLLFLAGFLLFSLTGVAAEKGGNPSPEPVMELASLDSGRFSGENRINGTGNTLGEFRKGPFEVVFEPMPEVNAYAGASAENATVNRTPGVISFRMPASVVAGSSGSGEMTDSPGPMENQTLKKMPAARTILPRTRMASISDSQRSKPSEPSPVELSAPTAAASPEASALINIDSSRIPAGQKQAPAISQVAESDPVVFEGVGEGWAQDGAYGGQAIKEVVYAGSEIRGSQGDISPQPENLPGDKESLNQGAGAVEDQLYAEQFVRMLQEPFLSASISEKKEHDDGSGAFQAVDVDTPPRLIKSYPPRYPYLAKRDDITGSITLQFVVTKEGHAVDTTVVESYPKGVFDEAALQAIGQYRFKPGIKDGKAVDVRVNLPIKFNLT
jgi:TonB family protein